MGTVTAVRKSLFLLFQPLSNIFGFVSASSKPCQVHSLSDRTRLLQRQTLGFLPLAASSRKDRRAARLLFRGRSDYRRFFAGLNVLRMMASAAERLSEYTLQQPSIQERAHDICAHVLRVG